MKKYIQPSMVMVKLQHQQIICESYNGNLQNREVGNAWSKESRGEWDDEDW